MRSALFSKLYYWHGIQSLLIGAWLSIGFSAYAADIYKDPGIYPNRGYINEHEHEYIDLFTGALNLTHLDLHIPGNGGLDINVYRKASNLGYLNNYFAGVTPTSTPAPRANLLDKTSPWVFDFGYVAYPSAGVSITDNPA